MKKYLKMGAFILSLALLILLFYIINVFTGYPASYFIVKNKASDYMEENYKNTDFIQDKPSYSLKQGGFNIKVSSPSSPDSHFSLFYDLSGNLKYDTYKKDVLSGVNTALRLSNQYKEISKTVFYNSLFPFKADFSGSFENAISGNSELLNERGVYPKKWNTSNLILDKYYDISKLSKDLGYVYLTVYSNDISLKTASDALISLKSIMEESNLPFKSCELWILSEDKDENGNPENNMHVLNFGWDEIYENKMEERVEKALKETNDFYNR